MGEIVEMIDLHSHILPGLDDGPRTLEESLQMCWVSYKDGVRTVVATPHTLNGVYENDRSTILSRVHELNETIRKFGVKDSNASTHQRVDASNSLRILPGADVRFCEDILLQLGQGRVVTVGDEGKFLIIEFPFQGIPYEAEKILFQLLTKEIVPIITHPERNLEVGQRPKRYYEMIRMGCLGQVTAMSLTGEFGPGIKRIADKLLASRLIHFVASDAHSANGRSPILSKAVKAAEKIVGKKEAWKMVKEYPQAVLDGRRPDVPEPLCP